MGIFVNSLSKKWVSELPLIVGRHGGEISPCINLSQSIGVKNSLDLISSASAGPLPSRHFGSFVRRPFSIVAAGRDNSGG